MEGQVINRIVGIKDGEVFVLNEVFNGGAVGYSMSPLTKGQVEEMKDPEYVRVYGYKRYKQGIRI